MPEARLCAAELDLCVGYGDDIFLPLEFNVDLTTYGGWEAQARPDPENGTVVDFTIDTSQQAAKIITVHMNGAVAAGIQTGWVWALLVTAPSRRTLVRGRITVEQGAAR